jgi:dTDP-glucose pyrophosphorylase
MIEVVVNNVRPSTPHHFTFIALQEHLDHVGMRDTLERIVPDCTIVPVRSVTEGAACTVLLAKDIINTDDSLMLANSDQWVDVNIDAYLGRMDDIRADGMIMTMWADDSKWSFVGFDQDGWVDRVVEKQVISNEATVGIYNWRSGRDFVSGAERMIEKNLRVNNEFYVAPVYNELIASGSKIGVFNVGRVNDGMYGLGVPSDLDSFLADPISSKATLVQRV